MKKQKICLWALYGLIGMGMVGCGNAEKANSEGEDGKSDGEVTTITFSLWDEIQSVTYEKIIDAFEEEHPEIHVEMQLTPWDQYWTKFDAAAGANQAADTFFMNVNYAKYLEAGVMESIQPWIEKDGFDTSGFTPALVDLFTYDGELVAMPKGMDSQAVAYNQEIFDQYGVEAPTNEWTWDDFMNLCAELKEKIGDDGIYPIGMAWNSSNSTWNHVMWQFGGHMFQDEQAVFNSPENVEAFDAMTSMVENGYAPDYSTISDTSAEDLFISGKTAMLYLPTFTAQKLEQSSLKGIHLVTLPKAKTKDYMLGGMSYGMNSASEHKDEAWEFLKFLGGEEANKILGENGADMPALADCQHYYAESYKNFDATPFVDQINYSRPYEAAPYYATDEAQTIYNEHMIDIFSGNEGVEEGLAAIDQEINEVIEANK